MAKDKQLGSKLWNTSLILTGLARQFAMYNENEGAALAENGAQVIATGGATGDGVADPAPPAPADTTGPEKRSAAAKTAPAATPTAAAGTAAASAAAAKQS